MTPAGSLGRSDTDALLRSIVDEVSTIGMLDDGATHRLAYSAEERRAHDVLAARFAGHAPGRFSTKVDEAGNRWITLIGRQPRLPPVLTGSHLDSVPHGGAWDGALGVYSGAVALLQLAEGESPLRSISLIAFASEESPRFAQSAYRFGSRAIAGRIDREDVYRLVDDGGITLADAMQALAMDPRLVADAFVPPSQFHALLELHIDQGLLLKQAGLPVSAVSAITGSCRLRVTVVGQADHSGAARMSARRDALAAASEIVLAAERIAKADPHDDLVLTVGAIRVEPGAVSVVPGLAELTVDIRSVDAATMDAAQQGIRAAIADIAQTRRVEATIGVIRDVAPIAMSEHVIDVTLSALRDNGLPAKRMPSHAGHDTGSFAGHPRLGMIFVRNDSGRSHSPDEHIAWADAVAGTDVLRSSLTALANEAAGAHPAVSTATTIPEGEQ
ncbi:Zn-dependent hydrolase [Naasia lichenicola]|uniref:Zn-dependent hydrolase n=1 Tax=Naasia lichenicola TaxID=2565933 RepID=A0A4S4FU22_9MICO|nr:Zn-dependent hydrolase [Naasia lichenicola]THG33285.1 Zn-dependent hydrolase [Naasia lichenicola]